MNAGAESYSSDGVWTIVVAAGSGQRFGSDKLQADLTEGRSVLDFTISAARAASEGTVLVVRAGSELLERGVGDGVDGTGNDVVVVGGDTRSESVRAGLAAVPDTAEVVLVHDAARPLADQGVFARVVGAVRAGAVAVVPVVPVVDTIRSVDGATLDRDQLKAAQTPQGFAAGALRAAHAGEATATDDATLVEAQGHQVVLVDGDVRNLKITRPADLAMARVMLTTGFNGDTDLTMPVGTVRVGQGFDSHPYGDDPARPLVLGGVTFDCDQSLVGHSDADVVAHACADALLGPTNLGDIGSWFPDHDPEFAGADSLGLLTRVVRAVHDAGWSVSNVDCTVVASVPKIAPQRRRMQELLSEVVGAPVTVKGKRPEGIGVDGVACWAVAVLEQQ